MGIILFIYIFFSEEEASHKNKIFRNTFQKYKSRNFFLSLQEFVIGEIRLVLKKAVHNAREMNSLKNYMKGQQKKTTQLWWDGGKKKKTLETNSGQLLKMRRYFATVGFLFFSEALKGLSEDLIGWAQPWHLRARSYIQILSS